MTESEWNESTDISTMLDFLDGEVPDCRLRLFACACCRQIWDLIDTDFHRRAVDFAEQFARGAGKNLIWLGRGNWQQRNLSWPRERFANDDAWASIMRDLSAEQHRSFEDGTAPFRYDHPTPQVAAELCLCLIYFYPFCVANTVATLRSAPFAYWQHNVEPVLTPDNQEQWNSRKEQEMASLGRLFREMYGSPFKS